MKILISGGGTAGHINPAIAIAKRMKREYGAEILKNCNSIHFATIEEVVEYAKNKIPAQSTLFLKASRSMKLERIIELLIS